MIARSVTVFVEFQRKLFLIRRGKQFLPDRWRPNSSHHEFFITKAAYHIHVDHRIDVLDRNDRVFDKESWADNPFFFSAETDEQQIPMQSIAIFWEHTREFQESGDPWGIIIGAVMYFAPFGR